MLGEPLTLKGMAESFRIAVVPGDGIGSEVVTEGLKVLDAVSDRFDLNFETQSYDLGAQRYLASGEALPDSVLAELRDFDAILLGAVGDPAVPPGVLERGLLLRLRFELDHHVNLRPVKLFPGVTTPLAGKGPEDIDFVVCREGTEGPYAGAGGNLTENVQRLEGVGVGGSHGVGNGNRNRQTLGRCTDLRCMLWALCYRA